MEVLLPLRELDVLAALELVHLLYNLYIYNIFGILLPRKEVDMPKRIHNVKLSEREKEELEKYVKQGKKSARAINRARVLLLANEEKSDGEIINALGVCRSAICKLRTN